MRTPFEIYKLYKEETSETPEDWSVSARIGHYGDIIIDKFDSPTWLIREVARRCEIDMPSLDYVNWLEEKVLKMIKDGHK